MTVDWRIVASSAACIAFVVLSVLMLRRPNQDPFPQPGREEVVAQIPETVTSGLRNAKPEFFVSQTQITPVNLADELDQLDVEIIESLNEIDRLKQQLERLAVVQEIDTLLAQHRRW